MASVVDGLKIGLVVPTLNAGSDWPAWIKALKSQRLFPARVLVIDSCSNDNTAMLAQQSGFEVLQVDRGDFDHGGTRQLAVEYLGDSVDIVVLLTQDAELVDVDSIAHLIASFEDSAVGCAYGRQLGRLSHSAIARHHRSFNYPETASRTTYTELSLQGLRAAFCSNSFAAYRIRALREVGGFPANTIFGEDMLAALAMMQAGWVKCYVPSARVWHAHDYTVMQDFRRYFDMGVMHAIEPRLVGLVEQASSAGRAFARSELMIVGGGDPISCAGLVIRSGGRWVGYQLGRRVQKLPIAVSKLLTMNKAYFQRRTSSV